MSKEEFMALTAEEMYNKYEESETYRKSNFDSMMRYLNERDEARKESEDIRKQIGALKRVIKSLREIL